MKVFWTLAALCLMGSATNALGQNQGPVPPTERSKNVQVLCNDGTVFEGTTRRGACSGRGGIHRSATGDVWVSKGSKVYHCPGDKLHGKTKSGRYMSPREAQAKGLRPVKGSRACPS